MFGGIPISELEQLKEYWKAFPNLRSELFTDGDTPYVELKVDDVKKYIKNHRDVTEYEKKFDNAFGNFRDYLKEELIKNMQEISISQKETEISNDIFTRLENIPLIDKYEAYQLLDEDWSKIAVDIEIMQTEGFEAAKKVDANMVIKKKDGKDQEIQEGWIGHVIPFDLVQKELLSEDKKPLEEKLNRLSQIPSEYEEIADSMNEEEKSGDYYADEMFVAKEVTKAIKELKYDKSQEAVELLEKLQKVERLIKEEKELKASIKDEETKMHLLTKETIENMSDSDVYNLLEKKWIDSLVTNLYRLPDKVIDTLVTSLKKLQEKYSNTYFDIEREIKKTETELCLLMDELEGNEFDMKGLSEFKSLLMGEKYE